ncbi:MAG: 4Fe-4S binding protein [Bacteroidaceae bacterium]|nr:4Fe-4S binding protein [Bacteroidaceae bacterium]
MLKKIRITLAILFWVLITWLLVDFTGTAHAYLGWMAKIQLLPALLAVNVGALLFIVALTLLFGRIYCSVICPLGVMQDAIAWLRRKRNKYSYSPAKNLLRYSVLVATGLALALNLGWLVALVAPYSTYGRIVGSVVAPLYKWGNNLLAQIAEHYGSYAFYEVDVWLKSGLTLGITLVIWAVIAVLAWRGGRTWCNTICPVGTLLGLLSRNAWLKPVIDKEKCISCRLCEKNCKAAAIDIKGGMEIDYSRCVVCGNCIEECKKDALTYTHVDLKPLAPVKLPENEEVKREAAKEEAQAKSETVDQGRRAALASAALLLGAGVLRAQESEEDAEGEAIQDDKTTDGGLADIIDKKKPKRERLITPPGSLSARNMRSHCTACQLCIDSCPNDVLRPSKKLDRLMQPEVSFERGYCRPECNRCSQVCPTGAILPITVEQRTAIQVGHAVWNRETCVPVTDGRPCGLCARKCPAGAIQMVPLQSGVHQDGWRWLDADGKEIPREKLLMIPVVNEEKCIGCGACENLCPSRPYSAIYVEGHDVHREI